MKSGKEIKILDIPTTEELENELYKEKYKLKVKELLRSTISIIVVVFAMSILITNLWFQLLKITGSSMEPTLVNGDIVLSLKKSKFKQGDVIAFYYNNHILVKRIIATSLDWVYIDDDGNVFVNDVLIQEGYVDKLSYGVVDIEFPFQVKNGSYFVLGDKRECSLDSRNSLIASIDEEDIIGKIILRVWPFNKESIIK